MNVITESKKELAQVKAARYRVLRTSSPAQPARRRNSSAVSVNSESGKSKHLSAMARAEFRQQPSKSEWDNAEVDSHYWPWIESKAKSNLIVFESYENLVHLDDYYAPASAVAKSEQSIYQIFTENAEKWREDTMFFSSSEKIILHKSYQRIIGLGSRVLPYIFADLEKNFSHWFWALESITGVDPVDEADAGNISVMAEKWLAWAHLNGYK